MITNVVLVGYAIENYHVKDDGVLIEDLTGPYKSQHVYLMVENNDKMKHVYGIESYVGYTDNGSHGGIMVKFDMNPKNKNHDFITIDHISISIKHDDGMYNDEYELYNTGEIVRLDTGSSICKWSSTNYPLPSSNIHWNKKSIL